MGIGSNPTKYNQFAYCGNDSVARKDSFGAFPIWATIAIGASLSLLEDYLPDKNIEIKDLFKVFIRGAFDYCFRNAGAAVKISIGVGRAVVDAFAKYKDGATVGESAIYGVTAAGATMLGSDGLSIMGFKVDGTAANAFDLILGTGGELTSSAVSYGVDQSIKARDPQKHYTKEELDAAMAKTLPSRVQKNLKMCLN